MAQDLRDHRRHPRVDLSRSGAKCLIDTGSDAFAVYDVSKGGISFLSDRGFDAGSRLRLNVENIFGTDIEVIHCRMFMSDETFLEAKYRIGARFVSGILDEELYSLLLRTFKG